MLILLLLDFIGIFFYSIFYIISLALQQIPFYSSINSTFSLAIGYAKGLIVTLPYLDVVWNCFLIIVTVEIVFILARLLLGSRFWASDPIA